MRSTMLAAALVLGAAGSVNAATYDYSFEAENTGGWGEWFNDLSATVRTVVGIDSRSLTATKLNIGGENYNVTDGGNPDLFRGDASRMIQTLYTFGGETERREATVEFEWVDNESDEGPAGLWSYALSLRDKISGAVANFRSNTGSAPVGVCRE